MHYMAAYIQQQRLRVSFPMAAKGGMSYAWIRASIAAQKNIKKLTCPVLLLHGEDDVFVYNTPFATVQQEAPNCRKLLYKGTYHEVLMEADAPRHHAIASIVTHITTTDTDKLPPAESVTVELATLPQLPVPLIRKALIVGAVAVSVLSIYATVHNSRDKSTKVSR
eukprot:16309-Heterococcus_DN1.PRE.2